MGGNNTNDSAVAAPVARTGFDKVTGIITVILVGEPRMIRVKRILQMAEFRGTIGRMLRTLLEKNKSAVSGVLTKAGEGDGTINNEDLVALIPDLVPMLITDVPDFLCEVLVGYAPELGEFMPEHAEDIDGKATDEEIVAAALEVLRVVLPLIVTLGKAALSHVTVTPE